MRTVTLFWLLLILLISQDTILASNDDDDDDDDDDEEELPKYRIAEFEANIGFYQAIELIEDSKLYETESLFQSIEVHQSKYYGKILALDGALQLTERDADSYNEMMAHIPMFQHRDPKGVLIIGGGDGYSLAEVLKHDVLSVDHVDLDEEVIKTCQKFFPQWDRWSDPRVKLYIEDGAKFIQNKQAETYDVIIQDSSDPFHVDLDGVTITPLPSGALYEQDHFCALYKILKPNGNLMIQAESYNIPTNLDAVPVWRKIMEKCGFQRIRYGSIMTSSYPTGQIGFLLAEKNPSAASSPSSVTERFDKIINSGNKTTYYHPPLQYSSFDIPLWVHEKIYGNYPGSASKDEL